MIADVTKAKLFTQRACVEVADECVQILGGYGYMREYGVERALRDARLGPIGGGTDEVMRRSSVASSASEPRRLHGRAAELIESATLTPT